MVPKLMCEKSNSISARLKLDVVEAIMSTTTADKLCKKLVKSCILERTI